MDGRATIAIGLLLVFVLVLVLLLVLLLLLLLLVLVLVLVLVLRNCLNNNNTKRLTNAESHTRKSRKRGAHMRTLENQEAQHLSYNGRDCIDDIDTKSITERM